MKILMLSREHPPFGTGGEGIFSGYLEKILPGLGVELTIIASDPRSRKPYRETKGSTTIYRFPMTGNTFLTKLPSFAYNTAGLVSRIEGQHDLVYSFSSSFPFLKKKLTRPLIVHFQTTRYGEYLGCRLSRRYLHAFLNKAYMLFDRRLIDAASGIIVLSRNMVSEIRQTCPGLDKEITILPNGVDRLLFKPLKPRDFDLPEKKILFVGRLDIRKGLEVFLHAFKEVTGIAGVKARFFIAGIGSEEKKLKRLVKILDLPVSFLGKVPFEKLPALYNDADLMVVPSLYEPFGMAALEAMACGTPTITSNALPDLGIPQFQKGSVKDLERAILDVLVSKDKLKDLSQRSLEVSAKFDWEGIVLSLLGVFKKFV